MSHEKTEDEFELEVDPDLAEVRHLKSTQWNEQIAVSNYLASFISSRPVMCFHSLIRTLLFFLSSPAKLPGPDRDISPSFRVIDLWAELGWSVQYINHFVYVKQQWKSLT